MDNIDCDWMVKAILVEVRVFPSSDSTYSPTSGDICKRHVHTGMNASMGSVKASCLTS